MARPELPIEGTWGYEIDDTSITYGPGWWPLYRDGKPDQVRLAPDLAYYAWGEEYVLLIPRGGAAVEAVMTVGPDRERRHVSAGIDLRTSSWTIPGQLPDHIQAETVAKCQRILARITHERGRRRRGFTAPVTAFDRWKQASRK